MLTKLILAINVFLSIYLSTVCMTPNGSKNENQQIILLCKYVCRCQCNALQVYFDMHHLYIFDLQSNQNLWFITNCLELTNKDWYRCNNALNRSNCQFHSTHAHICFDLPANTIESCDIWSSQFQGWGSGIFFHGSGSSSAEKNSGSGSDLKSKWRKKYIYLIGR